MALSPDLQAWWNAERDRILAEKRAKEREIELQARELERSNRELYRRLHPLKGRKMLEDYECAVSTFIKRRGGIKIPKDLREEFGGWNRLHRDKAMPVDEMAEELHAHGLIEEPTTNALIDGLKSGRKSARFSEKAMELEQAIEDVRLQREMDDSCPF